MIPFTNLENKTLSQLSKQCDKGNLENIGKDWCFSVNDSKNNLNLFYNYESAVDIKSITDELDK